MIGRMRQNGILTAGRMRAVRRETQSSMPPKIARATKSAGRERTLTQERILEGALELIARDGAKALTMRQLAAHLEVSPMAAYYYVESKEELLKLVGNAVLAEIAVPQPDAGPWERRLEELIIA